MRSRWVSRRVRSELGERGSITAEFATLMPALFLVLAMCLGAVQMLGQQLRLSDAAADAARAASRGDGAARVAALASRAVPNASVQLEQRGEFVCAELSSSAELGFAVLGMRLSASSCALGGGL